MWWLWALVVVACIWRLPRVFCVALLAFFWARPYLISVKQRAEDYLEDHEVLFQTIADFFFP